MTKLSTVPYAYESGLIARLLGVALEAVNAYGVMLLPYMKNRVPFPLINSPYAMDGLRRRWTLHSRHTVPFTDTRGDTDCIYRYALLKQIQYILYNV